ncbi:MAG: hypothetical protein JWO16_1729 [Sphingomonas bacterium]|jgi:uncharacterized membrane protein YagU involved in acid resistance|nr:hypothetical protein [Sphingomonas bacterium]
MEESVSRRIVAATLVAGALDILSAAVYTWIAGGTAAGMLRSVGGAIWPSAKEAGLAGSAVGLALHFAIMAVMAAFFVLAAGRMPVLKARWVLAGIAYGIGLWAVMNLVVLPLRFGFHPFKPLGLAEQFFSHIVLVGLPIAWFARR